jgi:hypothetical protein
VWDANGPVWDADYQGGAAGGSIDIQGGSMDCSPEAHVGWPDPLLHMVGTVLHIDRPFSFEFRMACDPERDSHSILKPCDELAKIHAATQDASLSFEADSHVYTFQGKRIGLSVTWLHIVFKDIRIRNQTFGQRKHVFSLASCVSIIQLS